MPIQQKLNSLRINSVWSFAKQETDFDEIFKAAQLFSEIPNREYENIETYFAENHSRYGVNTDRHRILSSAQLFGLITKTPFFTKGTRYASEKSTAIFDLLNQCTIGDENYNILKSEQLLKIRMKSIIDTTNDGYDQVVLPLLYSYLVLKELQTTHNIFEVTEDQFYTYIMTSKNFNEYRETALFLSQNPQVSNFIDDYKNRSRIVTLFSKNSSLIIFENSKVKLNPVFDDYFQNNLVSKINLLDLEIWLDDLNAYAYFLYNCQNFNINLIDQPAQNQANTNSSIPLKNILEESGDNEGYDSEYVENVDEVKEENINTDIAKNAHETEPRFSESNNGIKVLKNPIFGKIAIKQAAYKCIANEEHITFESKLTGKNFMEAHHLVPMKEVKNIYGNQNINIDCVENLVSLCPNCHRAVHYGAERVRKDLLTNLLTKKANDFNKIGLKIELNELLEMY